LQRNVTLKKTMFDNITRAIKAQEYYAEKFNLKDFIPKGDLALMNWLCQHDQLGNRLPMTSANKYLFCTVSKYGTQAIAARFITHSFLCGFIQCCWT
jgi:hypothetical protein